jgi:6-phosphogluconolactonase
VYCVNETETGGSATAFSLDQKKGEMTWLNEQSSEGSGPCHLCCDPSGRALIVANHGNGSVAVLPVLENGKLLASTDVQTHEAGKSKAHWVGFDPSGRFLLVVDKGAEKVMVYRLDREAICLYPGAFPSVTFPSGTAPRHLEFDHTGRFVFVNGEEDMAVHTFAWDPTIGSLDAIERTPTIPPKARKERKGNASTSAIACHPNGTALYVANRGYNTLACFRLQAETGCLLASGFPSCGGSDPQHFAIDPEGRFLYVANKRSDRLSVFKLDEETGLPQPAGFDIPTPSPACILFCRRLDP